MKIYKIDGDKLRQAIQLQAVKEGYQHIVYYLEKIGYSKDTYYRDRRIGQMPEKRIDMLGELGISTNSFIIVKIDGKKLKELIEVGSKERGDGIVENYLKEIGYDIETYNEDIKSEYIPMERLGIFLDCGLDTDTFTI